MPWFAEELLVADAFVFESVLTCQLHEAGNAGALVEELRFGVEFDEQVQVFGEAARACAQTAAVGFGHRVWAVGGEAGEVAADAREEGFHHFEIARADGKVGDVDAVSLVGDAVPVNVVGTDIAVGGALPFSFCNRCESVE